MKEYILNNVEAREVDRYAIETIGIPGSELMERAGSYVSLGVKKYLKHIPGSQVDVFCGTGNNGGDGFVAARQISDWGGTVNIWLAGNPEKISGDARIFFQKCDNNRISINVISEEQDLPTKEKVAESDLIIDALLGTGFKGEVRGVIGKAIELINSVNRPVISVDIPSGVSGDTGQVGGIAVKATKTITMGFLKRGLLFQPGKRLAGDVFLADLKYPPEAFRTLDHESYLIDNKIVENLLPPIKDDTYKHQQGKVIIFAGSTGMTGAAVLTAQAALRCGAGLVVSGIPESLNPIIESKLTETLSLPVSETKQGTFCAESFFDARERIDWSDVIVFGPGVSSSTDVRDFGIALVQSTQKPFIVDADGLRIFHHNLNLINDIEDLIITPHLGEFSMLSGIDLKSITSNIIDTAREFVLKFRCTLVLKGAPSIVVSRDGTVAVNSTGNPALATGGTGDVLTGMIAGLRAQKMSSFDAAVSAVYFHGMAGDMGRKEYGVRGLIAGDLLPFIPKILQKYEKVE